MGVRIPGFIRIDVQTETKLNTYKEGVFPERKSCKRVDSNFKTWIVTHVPSNDKKRWIIEKNERDQ
jgi:hypothetical protein